MTEDQKPAAPPAGDAVTEGGDMTAVVAAEADPHGATVVAAVADDQGVEAVAVVDTDYCNTLLAAEFANPDAAKAAYMTLLDAEISGRLRIDAVLVVHADSAGKIHVDAMTDHSSKTGVKWGAAGGLVLGILFPPSIIASTVAFGAAGGVIGKLRNIHHRSQVADALAGAIGPNMSGILALVHTTQVADVKAQIPEATKVTTTEVDQAAAKDITEEAKKAS
jgi:uncharacterized membrane protein